MSKLWFYAQQGTSEKKGPVPEETIRLMMTSGELKPADLVWTEGMGNWTALSSVAELQARAATPVAATAFPAAAATPAPAPRAAGGPSVVPTGLAGWMSFVGVMNIIGGALQCIGCITMIVGIPMILSGAALLAGKNLLPTLPGGDASLAAFLEKVKKFMVMTGMVYILGFVFFIVAIVINVGLIAAGLEGKFPVPPQ